MAPKEPTKEPPAKEPDQPNPAEAAREEATGSDAPIVVPFREQTFTIDRSQFVSARFMLAMASGQDHKILFELLGPTDSDRFIRLCEPGEGLIPVETEFFDALNKAAGWGNS